MPARRDLPLVSADIVARADALLVNLGTLDPERRGAIEIAIATAGERVPWVPDPVFVDRSAPRAGFAAALVARRPRAIRLNGAEFSALAGGPASPHALTRYAVENATVVGLTGDRDMVADATRMVTIANGDPLMSKVTALGCACLAVEADAWNATAAALILIGVAGEAAVGRAQGPGTFAAGILDAL